MSRKSKPESRHTGKRLIDGDALQVDDITDKYPKIEGVIQHLSVETNQFFDVKAYLAELEDLGIPRESVGFSMCG